MPSTEYILLNLLCPSLGVILATLTFAAPIQSLKERLLDVSKHDGGSLGDLNPTPWAVMSGNCLGWIAYSFLTKDLFVLFANVPGFMISIWLNLGAIKLQYRTQYMYYDMYEERMRRHRHRLMLGNDASANGQATSANRDHDDHEYDNVDEIDETAASSSTVTVPHERKVLWILLFWITLCSTVAHIPTLTNYQREQIVGYVVNINLCFFYFAPLTTMVKVCRLRSAASIHRPTTIMTCCNSFFWLAYGMAVQDAFIYVPNGVGLGFGLMQAVLLCVFGSCCSKGGAGGSNSSNQDNEDARETLIPEGDGDADVDIDDMDGADDSTGADRFDNDDGVKGGLVGSSHHLV